ncbi:MAG: EamA family transporter [Anaerolineales bacterium]
MDARRTEAAEVGTGTFNPMRDRLGMAAFVVMVLMIASNFVAVRFSNQEMAPFWGAGARFGGAALLFFGYIAIRRQKMLRGRSLVGAVLFGLLQFGLGYALLYWALLKVPAGLGSVIIASVPLFTLLMAAGLGMERISVRGVLGALMAVAGIAVLYSERASSSIPPQHLLAAVGAAACFALGPTLAKRLGATQPAPSNAIGMLMGASVLLVSSLAIGEPWTLPQSPSVWSALLYLVGSGSVGLFVLLLFVLARWPASVVAYAMPLSPIVAIGLSALLLDEALTGGLFIGAVLVMLGVVLGSASPRRTRASA